MKPGGLFVATVVFVVQCYKDIVETFSFGGLDLIPINNVDVFLSHEAHPKVEFAASAFRGPKDMDLIGVDDSLAVLEAYVIPNRVGLVGVSRWVMDGIPGIFKSLDVLPDAPVFFFRCFANGANNKNLLSHSHSFHKRYFLNTAPRFKITLGNLWEYPMAKLTDRSENLLVEAVKNMLQQNAELGLSVHKDEETSHGMQHEWEGIDDAFALKVQNLTFHDAITSAFLMVHSYKYVDDTRFLIAFEKELQGRAVPQDEIDKSINIVNDMKAGLDQGDERSFGWNNDMEGLIDVTTNADNRDAKTTEPFTGGGPAPKK